MSAEPCCSSYLSKTALVLPRVHNNAWEIKYCGYWFSNLSSHDSYLRHIFIGEKMVMWHSFEKVGAMRLSQRQRAQWRTEKSAGHCCRYNVLIQPSDIRPAEHPIIVMSLSDHSGTPEWIKRSRFEIHAHTLTRTLKVKPKVIKISELTVNQVAPLQSSHYFEVFLEPLSCSLNKYSCFLHPSKDKLT